MKKFLSGLLFVLIIGFVFVDNTNTAMITNDMQNIKTSKGLVPPNPEVYNDPTSKTGSRDDREVIDVSDKSNLSAAPQMESISEKIVPGSTQKVLMIPIAFTDHGFIVDEETLQSQLLSLGEELTDYYENNSGYAEGISGITLDCAVSSVVTSQHTMSYYGEDNIDIDDANIDINELAREAVELLDANGFDFTEYDQNNDGVIDNLFIIHAGQGQEEATNSDLIWSHHWSIEGSEIVDGILVNEYIMFSETAQLGVVAHEYGHTIGLPDLYDTNGLTDGITNGIGRWGIMGDGSWNHLPNEPAGSTPSNLCAWSKIFLGWEKAVDITSNTLHRTLNNTDGQSQILKVWPSGNLSSKEYFLVEYRRFIGYDAALPGEGVLIWHVDEEMINARIDSNLINANDSRLGLELEQADGLFDMWWLNNYGDDTDPFGGNSVNNNFMAIPYDLNYSNIDYSVHLFADILNIEINDATATADIYVNESIPTQAPIIIGPENGDVTGTQPVFDWEIVPQAKYYVLQIAEDEDFTQNSTYNFITGGSPTLDYLGDYFSYKLPEDNALNYATQYYWRICAINKLTDNLVNEVWSETREIMSISEGTNTLLDFVPTDVIQHPTEPILYLSDIDGERLVEYNYEQNTIRSINMPYKPERMKFYNGKLYVCLLRGEHSYYWWTQDQEGAYAIIDASSFSIDSVVDIHLDPYDIAVYNDKYVVISSGSGQWTDIVSYETGTSNIIDSAEIWQFTTLEYNEAIGMVYCVENDGLSDTLSRYYIDANGIFYDSRSSEWDSKYWDWDYRITTNFDILPNGTKFFTVTGNIFRLNIDEANDMIYDNKIDAYDDIVFDEDNNIFMTIKNNILRTYNLTTQELIATQTVNNNGTFLFIDGDDIVYVGKDTTGTKSIVYSISNTAPQSVPNITFSFDGTNANKLMGSDATMEYSLNGGVDYSPVSVANQKLTLSEVNSLTSTDDLLVRYKATSTKSPSEDCVIDITPGPEATSENYTLIWNDNNNVIHGLTNSYEYKNGQDWYTYNGNVIGIEGDCQIRIRRKATGTTLPGEIYTIDFTTAGYIKDGFDMNFNVFEFVLNDDGSICYLSVPEKNAVYVLNMVTGTIDKINFTYMPEHLAYYDNNLYVTLVENASRNNFRLAVVDTGSNTLSTSTEIVDDPSDLVIDRNGNIFVLTYNGHQEKINMYELDTVFNSVGVYNMDYPGKKIVVNPTSDLIYSFVTMDNDEVGLAVISYQNGGFIEGDYDKYDGVNLTEDFIINSTGDTLINGSGQAIQAPQSIDDNSSVSDNLGYTFTECYVLDDKYYLLVNGNDIDVLDLLNGSYLETFSFYYDLQQLFTIGNNIYSLELDTTIGLNYFRVFEKPIPVPDISFSFDGDSAGKLMGSTTSMEYSIDGGKTYYAVTQDDMLLNTTAINSISVDNDIRIRFAETETTLASQDKVIDIQAGPSVNGVSANDSDNTLSGMTNIMEFSINDGSTWTTFYNNLPDLTSNITLLVRVKARGVTLFGAVSSFTFTAPVQQPSGGGGGGGIVIPPIVSLPPAELPVVPTEPVIKEVELDTLLNQFNDLTTTTVVIGIQSESDKGISVDGDIFKQLKDSNKDLEIDGDVIDIVVPADAFNSHNTSDTKMELYYDELTPQEVDEAIANSMDDVGGLFAVGDRILEFHADLLSDTESEEVTAFNSELTITISLTKEDIAGTNPDKLGVYYYNDKSGEWEYVGGIYDSETNTLTFMTNHFSYYTIMQYDKTFDDITNHWARDYIEKMASKHITEGKSETTFDPDSNTTRAEFVALIVRALGLKDDGIKTTNYDDVDESKWYHSDINTAYDKGILHNMVSFNPEVEITREDMMVIIVDAMKVSGNYISVEASEVDEILAPYSDADKIARGNREAIALAIKNGIITGRTNTTLVPEGTATRAETMVVVSRLLDLIH